MLYKKSNLQSINHVIHHQNLSLINTSHPRPDDNNK